MLYPSLVKSFVESTPVSISVDADGIDEDGAPIEGVSWSGSANYQDHVEEKYGTDKAETEVKGVLYMDGDPFSEMSIIAGGTVTVFGEQRDIVLGMKARNLDGTVNYTRLDIR